jgi:3-oxoadipate enol-lactonase
MQIIDQGNGPPLVFVPALQGRWEYMRPAVEALSTSFRVVTFALCGERCSGMAFDPRLGVDNYSTQIEAVLDRLGIQRAIVCGVSFGALVAMRFAAARPDRVRALVVASAPGPGWHLRRRHEIYTRLPWIFGPVFLVETPFRLRDEMKATFVSRAARARFSIGMLWTLLRAPLSVSRMARRARMIPSFDVVRDCERIAAPTLVISGEPTLDHVVRAHGSSQYARLIAGATAAVLPRTGHLGSITRPDAFAALVRQFVDGIRDAAA